MKRGLLVLCLASSACTPDFLQSGRYACTPDAGAEQCPGAWRCGLEGYCHQQGDPQAWKCHDDTDCEGNFVCGITMSGAFRECHDPGKPQDWPCAAPSDCVAGWKCGWSSATTQQCHDPAAPQAWVCKGPDDCLGGWQCGLTTGGESRQCHDPAAPKTFWCESNADCVAEWQCGLATGRDHRECHDPAHPRDWACEADPDCLSWRCGTDLVCVNPSADSLGTTPAASLDGGAHINSLNSKSPITLLTVSPVYSQAPGLGRANMAFVQDGHLRVRSLNTLTGTFIDSDLGTNLPTALVAHGARGAHGVPHADFIEDLPDQLQRVTAAWPDGGRTIYTFADDGGLDHNPVDDGCADELGVPYSCASKVFSHGSAADELTPSVFGFSPTPTPFYVLMHGEFSSVYRLMTRDMSDSPLEGWTDFGDVPANHIRAITSLRHTDLLECVYLVDDRGLWVAQYNDSDVRDFEPVHIDRFSHSECGAGTQPRITSVTSLDARWLAVTAAGTSGAVEVALLDAERTWTDRDPGGTHSIYCTDYPPPYGADLCDPVGRIRVDPAFGPCVACPAGTTFEQMNTVSGAAGSEPSLEVYCGQANTAGSVFRLSRGATATECTRTLMTGESSFFAERGPVASVPAPGQTAWGGSAGQIWFGSSSAELASFTFDRAPVGVLRRSAGPDDIIAFTPHLLGAPSTIGLSSTRSSLLSASVQHAPSLAVSGGQLIDLSGSGSLSQARVLGFVPSGSLDSQNAVLTRSSTGRRIAVVSSALAVFVGDVEDVLDASGPPVALNQRLSTLEPVSSLAFPEVQAADAGTFAAGYAVTGSTVVRIVADTPTRWRTEAVPLPSSLVPRATWFDGAKGRVGLYDGSVLSLPSRVRISTPLPGNDAQDYAQACGQQLALAPTGLYRLESVTSGPIGQWVQLPLPPEVAALDFTEGRVHGVGNEAFVFTRSGEAARITFEGCPPE